MHGNRVTSDYSFDNKNPVVVSHKSSSYNVEGDSPRSLYERLRDFKGTNVRCSLRVTEPNEDFRPDPSYGVDDDIQTRVVELQLLLCDVDNVASVRYNSNLRHSTYSAWFSVDLKVGPKPEDEKKRIIETKLLDRVNDPDILSLNREHFDYKTKGERVKRPDFFDYFDEPTTCHLELSGVKKQFYDTRTNTILGGYSMNLGRRRITCDGHR